MTRYLFFDIDGTLLLTGGAGRHAMMQTMDEMFGLKDLNRVEVHGRTDRGIIEELFESHGIELTETVHSEFSNRYHELLPSSMAHCEGILMPGIVDLLNRLSGMRDLRLGILTGNSESAAWTKLRHFQLDAHFEFGGYGGEFAKREDVARSALDNCIEYYADAEIRPEQTWVIGDTIHDVRCARSIGANVVAVATGGADLAQLLSSEPDAALPDLTCHDSFLTAIQRNPN